MFRLACLWTRVALGNWKVPSECLIKQCQPKTVADRDYRVTLNQVVANGIGDLADTEA